MLDFFFYGCTERFFVVRHAGLNGPDLRLGEISCAQKLNVLRSSNP
ncbi:MAG: hypothetical protein AAF927_15925 [Bacteroidota bacterium]